MFTQIKQSIRKFISKYFKALDKSDKKIIIRWVKKNKSSWLYQQLGDNYILPRQNSYSVQIEKIAQQTNQLGQQPLWSGYEGYNIRGGSTRAPNNVRTSAKFGNLYTYLVQKNKPNIIVEFGTAFGVSGMYFLAGLESNNQGQLLTFEPNDIWRKTAEQNLSKIGSRFNSILGTFEEKIDYNLPENQSIDIAFIDGIHSKEFVIPQLEIIMDKASERAIIILNDINFSDSMKDCWSEVSKDPRFSSSVDLGGRVGILEI